MVAQNKYQNQFDAYQVKKANPNFKNRSVAMGSLIASNSHKYISFTSKELASAKKEKSQTIENAYNNGEWKHI